MDAQIKISSVWIEDNSVKGKGEIIPKITSSDPIQHFEFRKEIDGNVLTSDVDNKYGDDLYRSIDSFLNRKAVQNVLSKKGYLDEADICKIKNNVRHVKKMNFR